MADGQALRRLTTILAADVVGYSRLMGDDEAGTVAALKASRAELVDPKAAQYHGRTIKLMGDGALMEFGSVVDAVAFAVEVQCAMRKRNVGIPSDRKINYRIGINIGDVIVEGDDIYGDGVNVAARLESLAKPGGICLAGSVHQLIKGKLDVAFEDLGPKHLKNIAEPIRVFRIKTDDNDVVDAGLTAAGEALPLPDKPSIVVLPFVNMSGDSKQEFFADGMAEDIITALSKFRWIFVIARNSSFTYKGRAVGTKQIAQELGVRYVVEGSVRRAGNRIRVTAELIDAMAGTHIWADRYERELDDIFALQDEITETIVTAIEPELGVVERERASRKPPNNLDAWESYQRGLWHTFSGSTPDDRAEAKRQFQRACELDPNFAAAFADLAWAHTVDITQGFTDTPELSLESAAQAAKKAVSLDIRNPTAHVSLGRVYLLKHAPESAIAEMEAAVELNPNFDTAYYGLGHALLNSGRPEESIPQFEKAIRLNPRSPRSWAYLFLLARAYFILEKYEQAMQLHKKVIDQPNVPYLPFAQAAATLGHLGRLDEAKEMIAELRKRKPDFSTDIVKNSIGHFGQFSGAERIIDGLRKAGLPE